MTETEQSRFVAIVPAVPYDDRPEWDVVVQDSADPDFYVEGGRWSDYGEAVSNAENLAPPLRRDLRPHEGRQMNENVTIATVEETADGGSRLGSIDGERFVLLPKEVPDDVAAYVRETLDWMKREPAQAKESIVGPYDRALLTEEGATFADDRDLAQALIDAAVREYDVIDGDVDVIEAEGAIIERLGISPDETELGLTRSAVERIERFVSDSLGRPWTYGDAGMLGVDGTSR